MLKKGFTLAEVLMTLAIIGVVAAITLPSLNYNISNQTLEKQILKFYSQLHDGYSIYAAENGGSTGSFSDSSEIRKRFNVIDILDNGVTDDDRKYSIIGREYKAQQTDGSLDNSKIFPLTSANHKVYVLADGSVFNIRSSSSNFVVFVDVNGSKGPNILGKDLWKMYLYSDGSIDDANLSPSVRATKTSTQLKAIIDDLDSSCKTGAAYTTKNNFTDTLTDYSGCFAKLIRNKFKIED